MFWLFVKCWCGMMVQYIFKRFWGQKKEIVRIANELLEEYVPREKDNDIEIKRLEKELKCMDKKQKTSILKIIKYQMK